MLDSATVVSVESGVLRINMLGGDGQAGNGAGELRRAARALQEVLGVDWTIRFESAGAGLPVVGALHGERPVGRRVRARRVAAKRARSRPRHRPTSNRRTEIPEDYGEPPDPSAAPAVVRDPEEIAIALLSSELGARRLDPPA